MNIKRLALALLVVFLGIWITDFLIHGILLKNTYKATAPLWRTEVEMQSYFGFLFLGEFLAASTFVIVWAIGFADKATIKCALLFGLIMGLFNQATTLITYAVQPFPPSLALKWFFAGLVQAMLMGLLVFVVYKPKQKTTSSN